MSILFNINLIYERKVQPDGCRVEFSSGDVKNKEGSGSTKLAKEDTQGVDGTLLTIPLKMLKSLFCDSKNLLKSGSSNTRGTRQNEGGNL